jgi:hypothetical protein
VALVVGVPDPDVAAIFDDAGFGGGLDAEGFEGAEGGFDLFAAFYLHGHEHCALGVGNRNDEAATDNQRLRAGVKHARQEIGEAAPHGILRMLGLAIDHILLVEDGLGLSVVDVEGGVELAPAFDGLLVKVVGAALGAVEVDWKLSET